MISALNWDFWSTVCFDTNGGGGGGSDDDGSKSTTRSEEDIQRDINNALKESGGQWTPELNDLVAERDVARGGGGTTASDTTFEFEGPMPDGTAGFKQDVSTVGVDPFTGFLTGDDDDSPSTYSVGYGEGQIDPALAAAVGIQTSLPASPVFAEDTVYEGPMLDGTSGYTQDISLMDVDEDTGFITEDRGAPDVEQPAVSPAALSPVEKILVSTHGWIDNGDGTLTTPYGQRYDEDQGGLVAETAAQFEAEAEAADIDRLPDVMTPGMTSEEYFAENPQELIDFRAEQDQAYEDMLARAEARERERVADQFEAEAEAAGLTRPGQTTGTSTLEQLYGTDFEPGDVTLENVADVALSEGDTDAIQTLLENRPDLVLAPGTPGSSVITAEFPAGTVGTEVQESYQPSELETILEASPEARTLYRDLGIERRLRVSTPSDPTSGQYNYYDAAGNPLTEAQVRDLLAGAETVTVPGGTTVVRSIDIIDPGVAGTSPGLTPVDVEEARQQLEANIITTADFERMFPGVLETLPPLTATTTDTGMTARTDLDTSQGIESLLPGAEAGTDVGMTTRTDLDTSGGIDSLLPGAEASAEAGMTPRTDLDTSQGIEGLLPGGAVNEAAETALKMSTGVLPADPAYDADGNGVITSNDAVLLAQGDGGAEVVLGGDGATDAAAEAANQAVDVIIGSDTEDAILTGEDGATGTDVVLGGGDTGLVGPGDTGAADVGAGGIDVVVGGDTGGIDLGGDLGGDTGGDLGGDTGGGIDVVVGGDTGGGIDLGGDTGGGIDLGGDTGGGIDLGGDTGGGIDLGGDTGGGIDLGGDTGGGIDLGGDGPGGDGPGGDGPGGDGPGGDTEVEIDEPPVSFECPPGYRKVTMANGGSTCVPMDMVRPRVGPYTGTVDVRNLVRYTPFRPGGQQQVGTNPARES